MPAFVELVFSVHFSIDVPWIICFIKAKNCHCVLTRSTLTISFLSILPQNKSIFSLWCDWFQLWALPFDLRWPEKVNQKTSVNQRQLKELNLLHQFALQMWEYHVSHYFYTCAGYLKDVLKSHTKSLLGEGLITPPNTLK